MATYTIQTSALSITGERETFTYWVPDRGGYVYRVTPERPGTLGWQVCERLANTGTTLYVANGEGLPALIERELRRARRLNRRLFPRDHQVFRRMA